MGKIKILILILVILLTSCTSSAKPGILLEYHRTGGFAGFDDRLTIDMEGNAVLQRRNTQTQFTLDKQTLDSLEALLDRASFNQLNKSYAPTQHGADLFEYTLTYRGYTVQMVDTAVPEAMQPVLQSLNQIVEKGGKP